MANFIRPDDVTIKLVNAAHSGEIVVKQWNDFACNKERHDIGTLRMTVPVDASWLTRAGEDLGFSYYGKAAWYGYSFQVRVHGVLVWSGPMAGMARRHSGTRASAEIELIAETWLGNALRRRATHDSATYVDVTFGAAADDVWYTLVRDQHGLPVATPTGYVPTRSNNFPWQYIAGTSPSSAGAIAFQQQAGQPLLRVAEHVAEIGDLYQFASHVAGNTYQLDAAYPWRRNDLTSKREFRVDTGLVTAFNWAEDTLSLVNQFRARGTGKGAAQNYIWGSGTTQGTYGIYEGEMTFPNVSTVNLSSELTAMLNRLENPSGSVSMTVRQLEDWRWPIHYDMRDYVRIYDAIFGISRDVEITGWGLTQSGGNAFNLELRLGDWQPPVNEQVIRRLGLLGPLMAGDRFSRVDS